MSPTTPSTIRVLVICLLAVLAAPAARADPAPGRAPVLIVDGAVPRPLRLTAAQVHALPRARRVTEGKEGKATYEGVLLAEILEAAGVPIGQHDRSRHPVSYVVVEAADGYRALFSLAEIDPALGNQPVLLADRRDGRPLPGDQGPWRLIVPGDGLRSRWVRQAIRIQLASVESKSGM